MHDWSLTSHIWQGSMETLLCDKFFWKVKWIFRDTCKMKGT
jgi:hypothetical protein